MPRKALVAALAVVVVLIVVVAGLLLTRQLTGGQDERASSRTDAARATDTRILTPEELGELEENFGPRFDGLEDSVARRDPGDPMARGPVDAPVVLVNWSDWRCPFCGKFARDIEPELVEKYVDSGLLRLEWRDLAIFGEQSMMGARAGRAAAEQDRFWEFNKVVFAAAPDNGHPEFGVDKLVAFAEEAGVPDLDRFREDMTSDRFDEQIHREAGEATYMGITTTPAFSIGDRATAGLRPLEDFEALIDAALQESAGPSPSPAPSAGGAGDR